MQARALAVAAQRMPAARALDAAHNDLEAAPAPRHPATLTRHFNVLKRDAVGDIPKAVQ
jgi:hypothetical protein